MRRRALTGHSFLPCESLRNFQHLNQRSRASQLFGRLCVLESGSCARALVCACVVVVVFGASRIRSARPVVRLYSLQISNSIECAPIVVCGKKRGGGDRQSKQQQQIANTYCFLRVFRCLCLRSFCRIDDDGQRTNFTNCGACVRVCLCTCALLYHSNTSRAPLSHCILCDCV